MLFCQFVATLYEWVEAEARSQESRTSRYVLVDSLL
jgi:hypothetical protein